MSHYTEGVLQAYLDGEVAGDARAAVSAHVADCSACSARLFELRDLAAAFSGALQIGDVPALPTAAIAALRRRKVRNPWAARFSGSPAALMRAAGLVLGISAVGAAAVPGSPVQEWLVRVWRGVTDQPEATQPVVTPAPDAPP